MTYKASRERGLSGTLQRSAWGRRASPLSPFCLLASASGPRQPGALLGVETAASHHVSCPEPHVNFPSGGNIRSVPARLESRPSRVIAYCTLATAVVKTHSFVHRSHDDHHHHHRRRYHHHHHHHHHRHHHRHHHHHHQHHHHHHHRHILSHSKG